MNISSNKKIEMLVNQGYELIELYDDYSIPKIKKTETKVITEETNSYNEFEIHIDPE